MIKLRYFSFLLIGVLAKSQLLPVTGLRGEYNGALFSSGDPSVSSTIPDMTVNLVGFRYNNILYSTGVNDNLLSGTTFTAKKFRALPLIDYALVKGTGTNPAVNLVLVGSLADNNASVAVISPAASGPPALPARYPNLNGYNISSPARIKEMLEDGKKGLDLSTGIANISAGGMIEAILDIPMIISKLNDGVPDFIVSQIATPSASGLDRIEFLNASGTVLSSTSIDTSNSTKVPHLATFRFDLYQPDFSGVYETGTPAPATSGTRQIRLLAFNFSEFGITSANVGQIRKMRYIFGGTSDVAFLAFDEESVPIVQLEDDNYMTESNIDFPHFPLINDVYNPTLIAGYTLSVPNNPANGTVKVSGNDKLIYKSRPGFAGTDTFKYRITFTNGSFREATVTIKVLGKSYINPDLRQRAGGGY